MKASVYLGKTQLSLGAGLGPFVVRLRQQSRRNQYLSDSMVLPSDHLANMDGDAAYVKVMTMPRGDGQYHVVAAEGRCDAYQAQATIHELPATWSPTIVRVHIDALYHACRSERITLTLTYPTWRTFKVVDCALCPSTQPLDGGPVKVDASVDGSDPPWAP